MNYNEARNHIREKMDESRTVDIGNLEELAKYLHKCNHEDELKEMSTELVSNSAAFQELNATLQTYMHSNSEILNELKQLSKNHADMILIHNTKCPHPENWDRTWNRIEKLERGQAALNHEVDVKIMETNHLQDLEIKELMVSARNQGLAAGGGIGGIVAFVISIASQMVGKHP